MSDAEQPEEEVPQEEEPQEEEPEEEPVVEEKEPEPEPEPQAPPSAPAGDFSDPDAAWEAISKDNPPLNWYVCTINAKMDLEFGQAGTDGLSGFVSYLKAQGDKLIFGLLRVNSLDKGGSKRAKFIYVRHVGTKVPVMKKAKITPQLGKIGDRFPVKHITLDNTEDCAQLEMASLVKEFLRVGGAHKPDSYDFGPGQNQPV